MPASSIQYSVSDRIAEIVLNRPPVNALSIALVEEVIAAYRKAAADDSVGAVLLRSGLPDRFCGGFDLDFAKGISGKELRVFLDRLYLELFDVQYRLGKPSIAVVGGAARGAGMTMAISCDMVVASDKASFGYSEIDVGLYPGVHCVHLPRIIGRHRAFEVLFSGRSFGAGEALQMGLLNKLVAHDQLLEEARALAAVFAAKSPTAMRMGRDAFMRANDFDYRRNIETMAETLCNVIETDDAKEGFDAFLGKRKPQWRGIDR